MSFQAGNTPPASAEGALHIVFQREQLVSDMQSPHPLLPRARVQQAGWTVLREQFLGYWQGAPCYAVDIDTADELDPLRFHCGNLYQMLGRIDDNLFALAGRALQLLAWERDHQFCGRCGNPMVVDFNERAMRCTPCRTVNYPRINPCIITLVHRGEELLLARNVNFPGRMYSTLAGFIEAGESAEQTLHREVLEEVGVTLGRLRYFGSQSWPFPSQLMLGYFAEYHSGDIVCEPGEIADADWFHYRELPQIPPATSIAGQLIRHYIGNLTGE
ncbi:MAG TPA: NAD(+) diphosphatase [Kineobactrum sp.]